MAFIEVPADRVRSGMRHMQEALAEDADWADENQRLHCEEELLRKRRDAEFAQTREGKSVGHD